MLSAPRHNVLHASRLCLKTCRVWRIAVVDRAYSDEAVGTNVEQLVAEGACSIGNAAYEGSAYKAVRVVRATDLSEFDDFTVSLADGDSLALDGEYANTATEGRGPYVVTGWTDANLHLVANGETSKLDSYSSNRTSYVRNTFINGIDRGDPGATAQVDFSISAPWSAGESLDVVVDLVYVDAEDSVEDESGGFPAQWQRGTVSVTAADGTGFTLSPDTGDAATFAVTVDGESGDAIIHTWADGFQITCASGFNCR